MNYLPTVSLKENGIIHPYDLISRLLKDRIIIISSQIDKDIAALVISELLFLQSEDGKKPIHMYINSPGGSVTDGLAIIDTMNILSCPVYTYCIGSCASMGALICCSGKKGKRFILQHGRMMIHSVSCGTDGHIKQLELQLKQAKELNTILLDILKNATGKTETQLQSDTLNDYYLSAQQSIKYGLVDKILKNNK